MVVREIKRAFSIRTMSLRPYRIWMWRRNSKGSGSEWENKMKKHFMRIKIVISRMRLKTIWKWKESGQDLHLIANSITNSNSTSSFSIGTMKHFLTLILTLIITHLKKLKFLISDLMTIWYLNLIRQTNLAAFYLILKQKRMIKKWWTNPKLLLILTTKLTTRFWFKIAVFNKTALRGI